MYQHPQAAPLRTASFIPAIVLADNQTIASGNPTSADGVVIVQDVVFIPCSVNDNASFTDAALVAAAKAAWIDAATRQTDALIISTGPAAVTIYDAPQTRRNALKAAFEEAANGDPRFIWLDNSPTGENWFASPPSGTVNGRYLSADNTHENDDGKSWLGRRFAASALRAITALAA